jgi:hypothetical protein
MSDFVAILVDLLQQQDIVAQRAALGRLRERLRADTRRAREADDQLVELWSEVLDLRLYLAAALRLLVEKGVATADELRAAVEAVDASDGEVDGVFRGEVLPESGGGEAEPG